MVPCSFACAKIPMMGISTAEMQNPRVTNHHRSPDLKPNNGGNIKFPAPKNKEKRAKAVIRVSLVLFIFCKKNRSKDSGKSHTAKRVFHRTKIKGVEKKSYVHRKK